MIYDCLQTNEPRDFGEEKKMALLFVGGAFLGAAVGELLKAIVEVKDKASSCKSILERLKSTLECVTRQLQEIVHLSGDLSDRQKLEIDKLKAELEKGKVLVRKCSKLPCWSCYKRYRYSKKLLKLDTALIRFFQLDMQAEIWCDVKQLLLDVQEGNRKFDRLNTAERNGGGGGGGSGPSGTGSSTRSGFVSSCAFPGIPNLPVGLGVPLKEMKMELFRDGVNVLGLCAPGGCGKTTLASMLCQDEQVKGRFGENIFFLTISSSPNLITILQRLFEQMDHGYQVNEFQNDEDAVNHLGYLLRQREQEPMLLVLDDVWCDSFLQKFVVGNVKYKMLVTSRTAFQTFDSTYTLKMLSGSDAMTLFCHLAFPRDGSYERPDEDLVNKIVRGCNGFPLAIKVIAHSLRHQPARKWRSTERALSRGSSIFDTHKDLLECLATSLRFLKDDVRECFLDLGSFPEDQMIPAATLIDIWVELYDLDDEDEAYVNLLELSMRNLLNLVESTRKDAGEIDGNFNELSVIQHDLLRDLAIHQSRGNQNITQSKRLMMERREDDLPQSWRDHMHQTFEARLVTTNTGEMFSSRWCDLKFPEAQVLMLNFSEMDFNLPRFMENMSKLKVLIIANNGTHHASLDGLAPILGYLSNLKRIRLEKVSVPPLDELTEPLKNLQKISLVMCEVSHALANCNIRICNMLSNLIEIDIDYCDDLMEIPEGICKIRLLQKLSITNCHSLSSLPEEIGQMTNLEVLRLHACTGLIELPDSIRRLQKLRFLDVSDCSNLERLPEGVGELCNLRKLDMRRCSRVKKLPRTVIHLRCLKDVICDEEMRFQWKLVQVRLPELNVRMLRDEINLKWLGFDFMNQMTHY